MFSAPLQNALDLIDQGFLVLDRQLRLTAWNCALLRMLDLPPSLIQLGVPIEEVVRFEAKRGGYGPGDPERLIEERMQFARRQAAYETERTRPNGQVIRIRGSPVAGLGFVTLYTDVTAQRRAEARINEHANQLEQRVAERTAELRRSEAQMRLIADSIPALIAYFDDKKAYRYINKRYQEWFGLDPANVESASAREMLGEATYARIRPHVARALAGESTSCEYDAHCVDGRVRRAHTTLIPERAADGRVMGCFELTFDVTESRRAHELVAHAQKMDALGQLTGGLAHDFNNMLTVIIGNLSALNERQSGDAAVAEFVEPALAAAQRGTELIRALLGFARRQPLAAQPTDVQTLLRLAVRLLQRSLPADMRLSLEESKSPIWAWVDPSRLQDALINLVLNARDAQARTVRIFPSIERVAGQAATELQVMPGNYVRIDVADDGHGMDTLTQSRVFEPFFTTKRLTGTGLGLSMVYGFVRQSEGGIELASELGRGTIVSLWLPEAEVTDDDHATSETDASGPIADRTLALLVEDSPEVRKVVRRSLVDLGFAVIEAENGTEALQILQSTPNIDLVLSDVVMPGGVDGRAVARRAIAAGVAHVALMSGYVPDAEALDEGVSFLPKPFSKRQLADFLERQVRDR